MRVRRILVMSAVGVALIMAAAVVVAMNREYLPGIEWPEPPVVTPGENGSPPSDAIVLFDGQDLSAWEAVATRGKSKTAQWSWASGDIRTKQSFGDVPAAHRVVGAQSRPAATSQDRGNSGVFLQDRYELQVLDSYHNKTYFEGQAGAIYKQTPPMVNAMRPPGEWNVYDVVWTAPRFNDDGSLKSPAYITAMQNGVLILNHFAVLGDTPWHERAEVRSPRPGPAPAAGPRPSGAVPQHLGPRAKAARTANACTSRITSITTAAGSGS